MSADDSGSRRIWLEEMLGPDLKWCFGLRDILHAGKSAFQAYEIVDSVPFGKVLLLDGKMQSAEADERVYHECLVHPAMLLHPNPKRVFICGGGEGATAREVLRHPSVEECVMVDIDQKVCDFCEAHLEANKEAFRDSRLRLLYDDARAQLEAAEDGAFDVIIGDLADPVYGGPCYQLYTQEFYESVISKKLSDDGVFVTQSGPCGLLSAHEVFAPVHRTLAAVFDTVLPFSAHVPSFADEWGWNVAVKKRTGRILTSELVDKELGARGIKDLVHLDGETWMRMHTLSKPVRCIIKETTHIITKDDPRFLHGQGVKTIA